MEKMYNKRVALERINGRLDNGYEFENHTIGGKSKMKVEVHIAMSIMMTIALVNAKLGKEEKIQSLVKCAQMKCGNNYHSLGYGLFVMLKNIF